MGIFSDFLTGTRLFVSVFFFFFFLLLDLRGSWDVTVFFAFLSHAELLSLILVFIVLGKMLFLLIVFPLN